MSYSIYDFLGNVGVFLIVLMYLALHTDRVDSDSVIFSLLNAVGAVLILISLWVNFNLSSVIIEIFWLAISLFGLFKSLARRA